MSFLKKNLFFKVIVPQLPPRADKPVKLKLVMKTFLTHIAITDFRSILKMNHQGFIQPVCQ